MLYAERGRSEFTVEVSNGRRIVFRASSGEECEAWLQHMLQELTNQAQLYDRYSDLVLERLREEEGRGGGKNDDGARSVAASVASSSAASVTSSSTSTSNALAVEQVLRQTAKLWTLAVGETHENTARALDELGEFLIERNRDTDGDVLLMRAQLIRDAIEARRLDPRRVGNSSCSTNGADGNNGWGELQLWTELQSKAVSAAEAEERFEQQREREQALQEALSSQHESLVASLTAKASQADARARAAEEKLLRLQAAQSPPKPGADGDGGGGLVRVKRLSSKRLSKRSTSGSVSSRPRQEQLGSSSPRARTGTNASGVLGHGRGRGNPHRGGASHPGQGAAHRGGKEEEEDKDDAGHSAPPPARPLRRQRRRRRRARGRVLPVLHPGLGGHGPTCTGASSTSPMPLVNFCPARASRCQSSSTRPTTAARS